MLIWHLPGDEIDDFSNSVALLLYIHMRFICHDYTNLKEDMIISQNIKKTKNKNKGGLTVSQHRIDDVIRRLPFGWKKKVWMIY